MYHRSRVVSISHMIYAYIKWLVPPKKAITPQPLENIKFRKSQYGKTTHRSSRRSHSYNHEADMPAVQLLGVNMLLACPSSGVSHFWMVATEMEATNVSSNESPLDSIAPLIAYKDSTVLPSSVDELANVDCSIDNAKNHHHPYIDSTAVQSDTYVRETCQQYGTIKLFPQNCHNILSHTRAIKSSLYHGSLCIRPDYQFPIWDYLPLLKHHRQHKHHKADDRLPANGWHAHTD